LFEYFSPENEDTDEVSLDDDAIDSIAGRIDDYLKTHPYKRAELSLLMVLSTSESMPAALVGRISALASRPVRVSLHVAEPKARWESIARAVEQMSEDADSVPRERLFPHLNLALIDYQADEEMTDVLREGEPQFDIAVVTHVLPSAIQKNTEPPMERSDSFDPLRCRPSRLGAGSLR